MRALAMVRDMRMRYQASLRYLRGCGLWESYSGGLMRQMQ